MSKNQRMFLQKSLALMVILCLTFGITVFGADPAARTITILRIEGDDITMSRGDARVITPRTGQRLNAGNELSTGRNSSVYLEMDRTSILKMNERSQVLVGSTGRNLTLSVQSGQALAHIDQQAGEEAASHDISENVDGVT